MPSRPSTPSFTDLSRRGEQRPTLPPIRQIFGHELSQGVPPQHARPVPSTHSDRLVMAEGSRSMSRDASPAPTHAYAPGTPHSYPMQSEPSRQPSHLRNASDPASYSSYSSPSHSPRQGYATYPSQYARAPVPTGSYPYAPHQHPAISSTSSSTGQFYARQETTDRAPSSRYECSYCGKGFTRPSSLRIHLNTHTGEKPFACPYEGCGRRFSVQSNMRRHARVHTRAADSQGDVEEEDDSAEDAASQSSGTSHPRQ